MKPIHILFLSSVSFTFFTFLTAGASACDDHHKGAKAIKSDKINLTISSEERTKTFYTGTLKTGVMAIGGETTGVILVTEEETLELDLGGNADLMKNLEKWEGKKVTVIGTLEIRQGVEIPFRRIIRVKDIQEA